MPLSPDEFRKMREQLIAASENSRKIIEQLQRNPQWNEMVKSSAASTRALQQFARSPSFQRSVQTWRQTMASPAFRDAAARMATDWPAIAERLLEPELDEVERRLEELPDETVTD